MMMMIVILLVLLVMMINNSAIDDNNSLINTLKETIWAFFFSADCSVNTPKHIVVWLHTTIVKQVSFLPSGEKGQLSHSF